MVISFDENSQGRAQKASGTFKGWVIISSLSNVWIGLDRSALEGVIPPPAAGFNIELRDGQYIQALPNFQPTILPWNGEVWVLNGTATGAGDSVVNAVFVTLMPNC